jgi:signal transduction histidine kinase
MNLITNASDALEEKEGVIRLRTGVSREEAEPQVFLEVEDTGSGMTEETKSRMFDSFFTTKFTGRGLGLAATRVTVRLPVGQAPFS